MAHGIYGYAGREVAWHRLGHVNAQAETICELQKEAALDYEYKLVPIFWEVEQEDETWHIQEPDKRLVTIEGKTSLGHIVSAGYQFHQPFELATAMDEILTESKSWLGKLWKPETVIALGNGDTTCYCISLGENNVGKSECHDYLIVTDTVDGKHSLQAAIVKIRVVCANTLRLALNDARVKLSIRHSGAHRTEFRHTIEAILKSQGSIHQAMSDLAEQLVTEQQVNTYLESVFPIPERTNDKWSPSVVKKMGAARISAHGNIIRMVQEEGEKLTKWTLWNAVQESIEHDGAQSEKVTVRSLLTGTGQTVDHITRAYTLVTAL